jgi:NAD-dependent DNA ligase
MKGKIILFTGFRDATLESQIINAGGTISTTLTKKVNMLIFADDKDMKSNKKFSDAKARGDVEICSRSSVKSMLLTQRNN